MRKTSLALIVSLVLAHSAPALAKSTAVPSSSVATEKTAPARSGSSRTIVIPRTSSGPALSDEERYSVREAISKEAKNFRGGDAIVITATAAIIILLAIIIVILIT